MSKNKSKYLKEQEPKIEEKIRKERGKDVTGEVMYRAILVIAIFFGFVHISWYVALMNTTG